MIFRSKRQEFFNLIFYNSIPMQKLVQEFRTFENLVLDGSIKKNDTER